MKQGTLTLRAEQRLVSNEIVNFCFKGTELDYNFLLLREEPFFTISKPIGNPRAGPLTDKNQGDRYAQIGDQPFQDWQVVYQSEAATKSMYHFKDITLSASKLCSGNLDAPLKVQ